MWQEGWVCGGVSECGVVVCVGGGMLWYALYNKNKYTKLFNSYTDTNLGTVKKSLYTNSTLYTNSKFTGLNYSSVQ